MKEEKLRVLNPQAERGRFMTTNDSAADLFLSEPHGLHSYNSEKEGIVNIKFLGV